MGQKCKKDVLPTTRTIYIIRSENEGENEPKTSVLPLKALENGRLPIVFKEERLLRTANRFMKRTELEHVTTYPYKTLMILSGIVVTYKRILPVRS